MRGHDIGTAILVAVSTLLGACGSDAAPSTTGTLSVPVTTGAGTGSIPVVVDTDLAVDDLIALSFLLTSTDADVRAITVAGTGEVRCPKGLDVLRGLLAVTGDADTPIACGRTTPLEGTRAFPTEWRDAADAGWDTSLPVVPATPTGTAVDLLTTSLAPGGVTLLTLGPLTNVAEAFRADPELAGGLAGIVMMAGAVDVPGNAPLDAATPVAEWNVYVDPTAMAEVLATGAPITMVGLDATNDAPITLDFLEWMRVNAHHGPALFVQELLTNNPMVYSGDAYFWDPLAAAAVVQPAVLKVEPAAIAVTTADGEQVGRTARDDAGAELALATGADPNAFETLLLRTLDGLAEGEQPVPMPAPVADVEIRFDGSTCSYAGPATVTAGRVRLEFTSAVDGWSGGIAHLTGELTLDEIVAWMAAHLPITEAVPGIDAATAATTGHAAYIDARPPQMVVFCIPDAPDVMPFIAGSFTVTG